jgi:apolipoprotein N-acyltransferase
VAAIQTGVDTDSTARRAEMLRRDFAQTRDAADRGAELVVWREGGVDFDPQVEHTAAFRRLARETGAYLAIGYGTRRDGRHVNEVTLLAPEGEFLGRYGKDHPGTFAGDYSDTGGTYPVYETAIGPIATIICYDLDFTDTARTMTRNGARLIATPSNDVTAIAETHYTHLVFRSIENRVSTVKADSRFDSAVIDPWGRIVTREVSPAGATAATLVADVPLGSGESVFVTLGDWVGWVCVAGMLAFVGLSWWTRRRARLETRR